MRQFNRACLRKLGVRHFFGASDDGQLGLQVLDEVLLLLLEKLSPRLDGLKSCRRGALLNLEIVQSLGPAVLGGWSLDGLDVSALRAHVFEWFLVWLGVDLWSHACQNKLHL